MGQEEAVMEALVTTLLVVLAGGVFVWLGAVAGYDSRDGRDWRWCGDGRAGWRS